MSPDVQAAAMNMKICCLPQHMNMGHDKKKGEVPPCITAGSAPSEKPGRATPAGELQLPKAWGFGGLRRQTFEPRPSRPATNQEHSTLAQNKLLPHTHKFCLCVAPARKCPSPKVSWMSTRYTTHTRAAHKHTRTSTHPILMRQLCTCPHTLQACTGRCERTPPKPTKPTSHRGNTTLK